MDNDAERKFAATVASIDARESERVGGRAMWHAHHWPDEYDRCTMIGGRPVCRRCLTLYPLAVVVAVATVGKAAAAESGGEEEVEVEVGEVEEAAA